MAKVISVLILLDDDEVYEIDEHLNLDLPRHLNVIDHVVQVHDVPNCVHDWVVNETYEEGDLMRAFEIKEV